MEPPFDDNISLSSNSFMDENDSSVVMLAEGTTEESVDKENLEYDPLVKYVEGAFYKAKTKRMPEEQRWLQSFRNYRGRYSQDVQFRDGEKSKAFIKITKTKVLASYAQIVDILFSGQKFPLGVEPTSVTIGPNEDAVHIDPEQDKMEKQMGPEGKSGTISRQSIFETVGPYKGVLERIKDKLRSGPGKTPTSHTWEPNKEAAKNAEKKIHDQLEEADADKSLRMFIHEMCLFGTGVYKGPFHSLKEYPRWDTSGKYAPEMKPSADLNHVSIWNAYPDPDAVNMTECEFFIERHKFSKTQLRTLKTRPFFRPVSIEKAIKTGSNYQPEYWEHVLEAEDGDYVNPDINRWEVIEYWGIADKELVEQTGLKLPRQFRKQDQVQVNIWICNGQLLRLVYNPFTPARIPYYSCPYELNPYSFWGIGVADNMTDTQLVMNGFFRLAIDNAVLSSNVILDVDETLLVPGQDMKLYPGKVFRRQSGQPGQSVHSIRVDNTSQQTLLLFDKARQLADEATGMPSYSHGISGIMGVGRTASGMQMLMGAAAQNIKSVIGNLDTYLFIPLGKSMYSFNMQFDFDEKLIGDLAIVARGTTSLMRNEVRSQKIMQLLQVMGGNPAFAPYMKVDYMLRELVASLDLESDKCINDPREAAIQASIMADFMKQMGVQPGQNGSGQGTPPNGAEGVNDPMNSGTGAVPPPSDPSFSGTGGGSNIGQSPQQPVQ